jgi:hypothetical protein
MSGHVSKMGAISGIYRTVIEEIINVTQYSRICVCSTFFV